MTARLGNTFSLSGTQPDGEALQLFGDRLIDGSQKHVDILPALKREVLRLFIR